MFKQYNKQLKQISFEQTNMIQGYIQQLEKRYGVGINVHGVVGMGECDLAFEEIIGLYSYHNNGFCNAIKKNDKGLCKCVANKSKVVECAIRHKKAFYGMCYMGIEEFIYPVLWREKLIAVLTVGQFCTDRQRSEKQLKDQIQKLNLNEKEMKKKFFEVTKPVAFDLEALSYDIGILSQYIGQVYKNGYLIQECRQEESGEHGIQLQNIHFIVRQTMKFIKENYNRDLSLTILAQNSYCNATYLSRLFKEQAGVSVVDYINQVRVNHGKYLLDVTNYSVTEVSSMVGFNDPSYFTRVFKQLIGESPKQYRKK